MIKFLVYFLALGWHWEEMEDVDPRGLDCYDACVVVVDSTYVGNYFIVLDLITAAYRSVLIQGDWESWNRLINLSVITSISFHKKLGLRLGCEDNERSGPSCSKRR